MPTIFEVAKEAGVSASTVSRSFSDSTLLTDATRQRVLEVARRMNYRPPHARQKTLAGAKLTRVRTEAAPRSIAFQFFAPTQRSTVQNDPFYATLLAGAQAEAQAEGVPLVIHMTTRDGLSTDLPRQTREQSISGMLLVGTADPKILADFLEHIPRIVLVDNRDPQQKHDCILSDGIGGAFEATNYLFSLGHRRLAFMMSVRETATFQDRLTGYLSAHFRAGIPVDPRLIIAEKTEPEFVIEATTLLKRNDRPTGIVAANDPHAYRIIQICHGLGLRVPQDVSIIGFDDDQFSRLATPPLTTMRVDTEYLGRLGVRRLLTRLQESARPTEPEPSVNIEVPVSLIVRGSCAAPAH